MEHNITIVGRDVHKNSIEIVTAETAGYQEVPALRQNRWRYGITGKSYQEAH